MNKNLIPVRNPSSRRMFIFYTVAAALVIRLAVTGAYLPAHKYTGYEYGTHDTHIPISDDHRYIEQAMNLLNGHGFPMIGEKAPHDFDFRRGPLYPLFLSGLFYIFGFDILFVVIAQAFVSALCIPFIYRIANTYFGEGTARLTAMAWVLFPPSIYWALAVMRETLIIFLLLAVVWSLLSLAAQPRKRRILLSGFLTGLLLLQDPLAIILIPVFLGFLFLHDVNLNVRPIHRMLTASFRKKLLAACIWSAALTASISPWLVRTHANLGRATLGTASKFGIWNDWFMYYKFRELKKANKDYTKTEFERYLVEYRFDIARVYIDPPDTKLTDAVSKDRIVQALWTNSAYIGDLNHYNMLNTFRILMNDPSLYFGEPFGKITVLKFIDYWLNFAVMFKPSGEPVISSLYVLTNAPGSMTRAWAFLSIFISIALFIVFVRRCAQWRLILFVWLVYFLFYNIIKFRAEARYTLCVHPFVIMMLCDVIYSRWILFKKSGGSAD